jgi:uncharacterized protein
MLEVDLRQLARGPVETRGELPADDPALSGISVILGEPVVVRGRMQATGEGRFYWQASVRTVIAGECRRCLAPVRVPVELQLGALFSKEPGAEDDPDTYPVAPDATAIDVRPAVREELLLALPQYVVCREDCRGLCPQCGKDLNAGPCDCAPTPTDPRWKDLASHKHKFTD